MSNRTTDHQPLTSASEQALTGDMPELVRSWTRHLHATNKAPKTVKSYTQTVTGLIAYLHDAGMPTDIQRIGKEHVETYMADQVARWRPKTASVRYGDLQQFFKWAVEEREIPVSPMATMKRPAVPEEPVPVLSEAQLNALFQACDGADYESKRDLAILLLFVDSGLRLAELASLTQERVDLDLGVVTVMGKGRRPRSAPFDKDTAKALDRYLRARRKHPLAADPAFWLGRKGGMSDSGVYQIVRRRADEAGIGPIHPHQLRHSFAHGWLAGGGNEGDLMQIAGWKSRSMVSRYAASTAGLRAGDAHRTHSPVARILGQHIAKKV